MWRRLVTGIVCPNTCRSGPRLALHVKLKAPCTTRNGSSAAFTSGRERCSVMGAGPGITTACIVSPGPAKLEPAPIHSYTIDDGSERVLRGTAGSWKLATRSLCKAFVSVDVEDTYVQASQHNKVIGSCANWNGHMSMPELFHMDMWWGMMDFELH